MLYAGIGKDKKMITLYTEDGVIAHLEEVIQWFLEKYEGMEHLTEGGVTSPETWYTVTTILKRNLEKIRDKENMNWNTLVRQAKVKRQIKRLDAKIDERLQEMDEERLNKLEQEGKIKRVKLWDDFEDATFVDRMLRKNNR